MRDLANQNYSSVKTKTIPPGAARILLIVIAVIAVLFVVKFIATKGGAVSSSAVVLKDAPRGLMPVEVGGTSVTEDAIDLTTNSAKLTSVGNVSGSGTATRKYGDGSYSLTVSANLPNLKGDEYQAWIVGNGQVVKAGKLSGSGTSWNVTFNDKDKYSKMNEIWVTHEITTYDEKSETHVLEGSF